MYGCTTIQLRAMLVLKIMLHTAFAFWYCVFLLFMEREIRELTGNQDFYIPYWDWTRTTHCNICTNQYFGGVGHDGHIDSASPFSEWEVTAANGHSFIPTQEQTLVLFFL